MQAKEQGWEQQNEESVHSYAEAKWNRDWCTSKNSVYAEKQGHVRISNISAFEITSMYKCFKDINTTEKHRGIFQVICNISTYARLSRIVW